MNIDTNRILILLLLLGLLFTLYKYQNHINGEMSLKADAEEIVTKKVTKKAAKKVVKKLESKKKQEKKLISDIKKKVPDLISLEDEESDQMSLGSLADVKSCNSVDELSIYGNKVGMTDNGSSDGSSEDSFFFQQEYT